MIPTWQVCATIAEHAHVAVSTGRAAVASGWGYLVASDVSDEIAQSNKRFAHISYTSLGLTAQSWGRQVNEQFYYDGTSYTNTEGNGIQIPSAADDHNAPLFVSAVAPVSFAGKGEFTMLMQVPVRAYDNGAWSIGSKLSTRQIPAHVIISQADAQRYGMSDGQEVVLTTPVGSALIPARVDGGLAEGHVLLPAVAGAPLSLALGAYTRVSVRRAE
jgi:NADH-quinone oxidoreductase subunit G